MRLSEVQREFSRDLVYLKIHILALGYEFTEGDSYRDPRVHGEQGEKKSYSSAKSAHKQRLADDINLFLDGVYLTDTEDYRFAGEYWKSIGPENRWGGDFDYNRDGQGDDGNHFSRRHWGIE